MQQMYTCANNVVVSENRRQERVAKKCVIAHRDNYPLILSAKNKLNASTKRATGTNLN